PLALRSPRGPLRPPPAGTDVPGWLRQIILRGLSVDPTARWPSMASLLTELSRDPAARRRRWAVASGVVAVVAMMGVAYGRARHERSLLCRGAEAKLRGVWDRERMGRARAAFVSTAVPDAGATFERVSHALDGYAQRWTEMHTGACEATRLRGEQSEELLDLRMLCLGERLDALRATTDIFTVADRVVVAKAKAAVSALPPLDDCSNLPL